MSETKQADTFTPTEHDVRIFTRRAAEQGRIATEYLRRGVMPRHAVKAAREAASYAKMAMGVRPHAEVVLSETKRESGAEADVEVYFLETCGARGGPDTQCRFEDVSECEHAGWYWQEHGTHYNADGSCHPDCGPIVMDAYDITGRAPLLNDTGEHAHENIDGRCWHESWCDARGPFATEAEARADADADLRVMRHVHSVIAGECFECGSLGKQACAPDCKNGANHDKATDRARAASAAEG